MEHIIQVENLVKQYRKAKEPAVRGVTFAVRSGEFFAFLGPNGAGKTTTISILTTTLAKTSGTVTIAGYDLDRQPKQVRRSIGIIFQNPSLDPELTAEENIRLHVCLYGLYPYRPAYRLMSAEYRKRIADLAEMVGIQGHLFQKLKKFSGGKKRKLEIIRSLMHRPKVLFLDEPTSGLDAVSRRSLWEYLRQIRDEENTTIFLTTHYLDEAEGADRVCIINQGRIEMIGAPHELKQKLISRYMLIDAPDRKRLGEELREGGWRFIEAGDGFRVFYDSSTPQDIIAGLKTPLSKLDIYDPSLEEAYIRLITREEGGEEA
ncbi:ATP-binding cassette domain-containing protein [Caldibacillus debilis]|uniref:ATP-binding cassette domain-containing protein n=1 Tax=Caldibacillus debilis TaxID=301148 RepID=UPI002FDAC5C4